MGAVVFLVIILACAFGGWAIGKGKGRPLAGWLLGFFLGVIGLIIIALLPRKKLGWTPEEVQRMVEQNRPLPPADYTQAMRRVPPEYRADQTAPLAGYYDPQTGRNSGYQPQHRAGSGFDTGEPDWTQLHG